MALLGFNKYYKSSFILQIALSNELANGEWRFKKLDYILVLLF